MDFKIVTDDAGLNQTLFQVTHGLYILTSKMGEKLNGQCLDALMQVTNMPPRMAIGVGKRSLTHEYIAESGVFVANVLDKEAPDCFDMVRRFGFKSGRKVDKFEGIEYELGENGSPILPASKAFYECEVVRDMCVDLGTHTIFIGAVRRAGEREPGVPLTYNEYRRIMKKGG